MDVQEYIVNSEDVTQNKHSHGFALRSGDGKSDCVGQKSISIDAPSIGDIEISDRKEILSTAGKEIASSLGSRVLLGMLAECGKSMRQVARDSGFDVSVLSNIANGKRISGPELWTLVALAEAMNLDIQLNFSRR